jgi:hypothetical protein
MDREILTVKRNGPGIFFWQITVIDVANTDYGWLEKNNYANVDSSG